MEKLTDQSRKVVEELLNYSEEHRNRILNNEISLDLVATEEGITKQVNSLTSRFGMIFIAIVKEEFITISMVAVECKEASLA